MSAQMDSLKNALAAAEDMRVQNRDPEAVAHWLLQLHARCQALEGLLRISERYLVFGMPEQELAQMERLIENLREQEFASGTVNEVAASLPL